MLSDHSHVKNTPALTDGITPGLGYLGYTCFFPCVILSIIVFIRAFFFPTSKLCLRVDVQNSQSSLSLNVADLRVLHCCRMNDGIWHMAVNTHRLCSSGDISLSVSVASGFTRHHGEGKTSVNYRSYEGGSALYKSSTDCDCVSTAPKPNTLEKKPCLNQYFVLFSSRNKKK